MIGASLVCMSVSAPQSHASGSWNSAQNIISCFRNGGGGAGGGPEDARPLYTGRIGSSDSCAIIARNASASLALNWPAL